MGAVERQSERFERDTPIEDGCMGLVHMADGTQIFMQCDLDMQDASCARFVFRGTEGMVETTETWTRLFNAESGGWQTQDLGLAPDQIDTIGGMANARQTKELIAWIDGAEEHRGSGERARDTIEILMALLESARRHQVIRLPLEEKGYPLELMLAEGLLEPTQKGPRYSRLSQPRKRRRGALCRTGAQGMSHHPIMRALHEEKMERERHGG